MQERRVASSRTSSNDPCSLYSSSLLVWRLRRQINIIPRPPLHPPPPLLASLREARSYSDGFIRIVIDVDFFL